MMGMVPTKYFFTGHHRDQESLFKIVNSEYQLLFPMAGMEKKILKGFEQFIFKKNI